VSTKTEHFIPLAIVFRRKRDERNADVIGNKQRKADRLARKYLTAAKKTLGQKEADFSKDKIQQLLTERQVDSLVVQGFDGLLENCELARYTPITTVTMQQDYDKAAQTIAAIDKQIR